jgi:hypothetical protein
VSRTCILDQVRIVIFRNFVGIFAFCLKSDAEVGHQKIEFAEHFLGDLPADGVTNEFFLFVIAIVFLTV